MKNKTTISPSPWTWWSQRGDRPEDYDLDRLLDVNGIEVAVPFRTNDIRQDTNRCRTTAFECLLFHTRRLSSIKHISGSPPHLSEAIRAATYVPEHQPKKEEYGYA